MDMIDMIYYINLEGRKDRDDHFKQEIKKLCVDPSKIRRINAVYNTTGALGCTLSHIKVIEDFENNPALKTCIIFEDDFTFNNSDITINNSKLNMFFNAFDSWDLLALAYNPDGGKTVNIGIPNVHKAISIGTSSGYCLHKGFANTLKINFQESANMISKDLTHFGCLDVNWKKLQPLSKWYVCVPAFGYQYENFSDIEKRVTNYKC
jgi:GR25 family glycosyltransferase involved in LPS biosynthesis